MSNPCPECGVDVNDLTAEIDSLRARLRSAQEWIDFRDTQLCERTAELVQLREFKQSVDRVLEVLLKMQPRAAGR